MRVETVLTGMQALVMKNPQMADPDFKITKDISRIVAKGSKMTEEDRNEKQKLQFTGSLYTNEDGPYIPAQNIRKCFIRAATIRKLGTAVERAVLPVAMAFPLDYPGPRDINKLWADPTFHYRTMVNANPNSAKKSMVPSMRPMFPVWNLTAEWELITEALDFDKFVDVVVTAGMIEGLGDNRKNGYGRFKAEVRILEVQSL